MSAGLPVIATKLHPPAARRPLLPRAALMARLEAQPRARLLLVSAPAGCGKTTLLSAWSAAERGRPSRGLSLDAADAEPVRFWTYAIEALRRAAPGVGARSLAVLHAPGTDVEADVLPHLVNELAGLLGSVVLVLDDSPYGVQVSPAGVITSSWVHAVGRWEAR